MYKYKFKKNVGLPLTKDFSGWLVVINFKH